MSDRWYSYFADGTFELHGSPGLQGGLAGGEGPVGELTGAEFWTRPDGYRSLASYPKFAGLEGTGLAIFKVSLVLAFKIHRFHLFFVIG